jgi:hypothetical protein
MSNPQDCLDKLRQIAEFGSGEPRHAAAKIVDDFVGSASEDDMSQLRMRLEDTLLAAKYTIGPLAYLDHHSRWLAALEGACAEARRRQQRAETGA